MNYKKRVIIAIIFVLLILSSSFADAQSAALSTGLTYLQSTQSSDGYWGAASEVPYNAFVETCTVADSLKAINAISPAYATAIQWINTTDVNNSDYLLAKLLSLSQAGIDVSTIRENLLSIKNSAGGWERRDKPA
jgi:hypothetical protein